MNAPKLRFKGFKDKWEFKRLEEMGGFLKGKDLSKGDLTEEGHPCVLYGELYTKYDAVINKVTSFTSKTIPGLVKSKKQDVLIPSSGESAIDIACASSLALDDVLIGGDLNIFRPIKNINGNFLSYQINGKRKNELSKYAQGATVVHLYSSSIKNLKVAVPGLLEQEKISCFLDLLNKKIQLQQEKINLLKEQKKGYMQMIFNQEIQFKEENDGNHHEWREVAVSGILTLHLREIPKPNESYIRLGLRSHAKGTFHEVINNPQNVNMDKLFVVHEGDFIINITFAWEQALAIADKEDHGKLVSHRFPTYRFTEGHYSGFYKYYFTTKYFKYCLGNASPGGAGRNRVLNKKDFMNIRIKVPKYDEQLEIAKFLFKLDQRIQLEQQKMNNLQEQKKGFMQQMFI
ncbi:restriction endonuclease subunit S [Bacillus cereus]|uniref:restriction endonuclease subunit S n=1 Tax=Bacillus cereus TaxID=1396 RepID=UPI001FFC63E6|nr:restriction endonuclease subunit S [Bacillus cereus]UPJ16754.1 restriction endonuclease subunit S [Bacillus cereus]